MDFCRWLSERTGLHCTLPTEAQWEWACRAGTGTDFSVGEYTAGMKPFANIADESLAGWNHGRAESGYRDELTFSVPGGRFAANSWGLHDMHGNVAEWCRTSDRPYPYGDADGRNDLNGAEPKVIRGGSWNDTLQNATSATRWRYDAHKPVYNVGFRVVIEGEAASLVQNVREP
jgi:formylglycine-generating enzyme required for sulfatase activity